MKKDQRKTVFIVDDDEDLRDALSMLMRAAGLDTETFATAGEFLQHFVPRDSCCLVLDIRMPGMTGLELQAELHRRRIQLPIIFLTGHGDVPLAVKAMKAGAADFMQKPLDEHRLVVAVTSALRPAVGRNEEAISTVAQAGKLASLSRRERDVLEQLVKGKQNREIAEALFITVKTVEFHRANIREKLGVSSLPDLFRIVFGDKAN